ncbi:hypothetical protein AMAG_18900 [Allomyces macrogynus ATCC 38327]|uniref:Transcription factor IIIC 90kDa subunit N-terminal domain-containing protein n=1 Tax=Allomyces macrogynus (strain ATCC 38327) TaxID=578462 RepID=A0A0L0SJJ1_ALLM3|nr:hypothetical protein AMAG_18900 [Allomyces macrogynus ATCC 38327]|eukprot:KNE62663.1 hypothetical protein AMAG_18900 [Allomyces macrogynus ATCC 38327]
MSAVERTLILKAAPSVPAGATNLAWSDDNQLVAVTADALAILTPAPTFRATGPDRTTTYSPASSTLNPPSTWSSSSSVISSTAVVSPRQSTPWGGCALLAWTHDYRVTVHAPAAHTATSSWPVVLDLTPHIHQGLVTARGGSPLDAQIVSAAWSPGPPPPPEPVASPTGAPLLPPVARSVIALGSKAGHLSLWAYAATPNDPTPHIALEAIVHLPTTAAGAPPSPAAQLVPRADDAPWVTALAWSPASHWLAYALSTGAVGLVHVSLSPDSQQLSTHLVALVADADPRLVSTLTWVAPTVVAAAKGNAVFLWDVAAHTLRTVSVGPHGVIAALVPTADGTAVRVFTVAGNMYVVTLDGDVDHAEARATQRVFLARHGIYVPKGRQAATAAAAAAGKASRTSPASNGTTANGQGDEDDEEEEEEEDEDDEGLSVPSLTKKQARFYGACRSPNGIFTVVLYSIFPLNELHYRTDKSNTSFIDILPTTPVGDTDVEDAIFARLLHALQRGAGVPPTDAAAVPLGPGPWTLFWDLLAHVRHERRGLVPDMSSLARRLARVLDHWAIESAHAVQATHGVVPLFGRLRDFYTPMRWQSIVHRVLPAPTVLDLVHPAAEPPLPPPLAVHAAYLAEINKSGPNLRLRPCPI